MTEDPDRRMRLADAAAIAFPCGSITVAYLRREAKAGRLEIWRIAGKDFTTLAAIESMVKHCRVQPRAHVYGSGQPVAERTEGCARPHGSSSTGASSIARDSLLEHLKKLKNGSRSTSAHRISQKTDAKAQLKLSNSRT